MSKNLVAMWYGPGIDNLRLEELEIPKLKEGEVLIKVKACYFGALSYRALTVGSPKLKPPKVLGRMISGDLVEVGSGVNISPGTRVAINPEAPCGHCFFCKKNAPQHCLNLPSLNPGGFAEYIKLSPQFVPGLAILDDNISYEEAAYTETLACVISATLKSEVTFGDVVVIVGCGGIGLTFIPTLLSRGVSKIIAMDIDPIALRMAKDMGATITVNPLEDDLDTIVKEHTNGYGADVVIEAVGSGKTYEQALNIVRADGTVVGFGGAPKGESFQLDPNLIHYKTVKLVGTWHYSPDIYQKALDMIIAKKIILKPIITHKLPLKEIHKAVEIFPLSECKTLVINP